MLHKSFIIKFNLCIIKCQIVYLYKSLHTGEGWKGKGRRVGRDEGTERAGRVGGKGT